MHNAARHMTRSARLRIIVLLLLSLVSAMPDVFPDGGGHLLARAPESIHHENEIPEACKVSLRLEADAFHKQLRKQQPSGNITASPTLAAAEIRHQRYDWARPAYYRHLHRYNLF